MSQEDPFDFLKDIAENPIPAATAWLELTEEEYAAQVEDLREFVRVHAAGWRFATNVLLPCWDHHPEIVIVLGAWRDYTRWVFSPGNSGGEMYSYLSMTRLVRDELTAAVQNLACTMRDHQDHPAQPWLTTRMP